MGVLILALILKIYVPC